MSDAVRFEVRFVPAGTGPAVWDDPYADHVVHRFMPPGRKHAPMLGVVHMGAVRPTPPVLRNVVITVAEDVKAGRYGDCSLFVCSQDEDTRSVIGDLALSQNVAMFLCSTYADLKYAEPVGGLTAKEHETLRLVSNAGGTVNALGLAKQIGIEQTAAGNRLVSLQKKGFVQRVERPHPAGDLFVDPRSVVPENSTADCAPGRRALAPNRTTVEAIEAARRGEVEELGTPTEALAELNRED